MRCLIGEGGKNAGKAEKRSFGLAEKIFGEIFENLRKNARENDSYIMRRR